MLKSLFNLFIFSSFYIAGCAVIMTYQLQLLFPGLTISAVFYFFVFFSTVCSYNFHWWLTQYSANGSARLQWALQYKWLHLILYGAGLIGSVICFFLLRQHWLWIAVGAFVTFLYSAPKIQHPLFMALRKVAIGKTFFLAFVWMYVTTLLPVLISTTAWPAGFAWMLLSRFFLIYAICILFDYRDRDDDRAAGIKSMITQLNEKGINYLFTLSIVLFVVFTMAMYNNGYSAAVIAVLLLPGGIVAALYKYAKRNFSDYLYYFVLDGLMMLSGLLLIVLDI